MSLYTWLRYHSPLTRKGFQNRMDETEGRLSTKVGALEKRVEKLQEALDTAKRQQGEDFWDAQVKTLAVIRKEGEASRGQIQQLSEQIDTEFQAEKAERKNESQALKKGIEDLARQGLENRHKALEEILDSAQSRTGELQQRLLELGTAITDLGKEATEGRQKAVADLLLPVKEQAAELEKQIHDMEARIRQDGEGLQKIGKADVENVSTLLREHSDAFGDTKKRLLDTQNRLERIEKRLNSTYSNVVEGSRYASEGVWAHIFNQTIIGTTWLKDASFSPGRWAIGYQYLYVLYRILNEVHPKNILELGLGQSTKMISQYAAAFPEVRHQVVEHDLEWISFFARNYTLPSNTEIVRLDREFVPYKEADKVRVFKGLRNQFQGQKFDFISIDAPLGGDMKQYARIDVLQMLPDILSEDFIIMIDDCNRSGETHTVKEMTDRLAASHISCAMGRYSGKKDCVTFAAEKLKFVCSM